MKFAAHDWPVISALLDEALELSPERRGRWLDELPDGPSSHRRTLEQLLADHASVQTLDFLRTLPKLDLGEEPSSAAPDEAPGTVGPYRLLREIGRGGMGSVWLAERVDGLLKRQVALKLPHPGLATRAFGERLARERDILASLAHPHIARLYDAGLTLQGQPYIALAYVQGQTLIEHCDAGRLGLRERIALFQQVLDAVQYAHAHLVIHRDLKPSNVLVDEQGQVHLLDFGIAKLLVDGQAEATELTLDAGQALTPDYASPEQIGAHAISTASDVYSLGVLLYELLAGQRPYRLPHLAQAALVQAVLEVDVPRPSVAAARSERGAAAHASSSRQRARALHGDLDTIVLKALKKIPEERYATVQAMQQDLQRYLDGEPVLARPDSVLYRSGKFVRRHRFGVAAITLLIFTLGGGLAGTVWQARQARQEAQRAQAVKDFLIGLFNAADPVKAQGRELTVRQMLDRGQRDLQTKLAAQPRLNAELSGVLVDLYLKLGDEKKALPLAQARSDLTLELSGAHTLEHGDALASLASVQAGLSNFEQAYKTYQQAWQVLSRYPREREGELLRTEASLGVMLSSLERYEEAGERLDAVLPKLVVHFGPRSWEVIENKAHLATTYTFRGQHAKAAALHREIEPMLETVDATRVLDAAAVRNNIAYAQWEGGQLDEAEESLRRVIDEFDRLAGPDNSISLASQRTLGLVLMDQGRYDLATRTFDANVARALRLFGEDHSETKLSESFGVLPLIFVGRSADAETMARRSLRDSDRIAGVSASITAGMMRRLSLALIFNGKAAEALQLLQDLAAQEAAAGVTDGAKHGRTLLDLAGAYSALGRLDAAAEAARQAEKAFAAGTLTEYSDIAIAHAQLTQALALARSQQVARAEALIEQAQAHLQKKLKPGHPGYAWVQLVRAEALRGAGHPFEAERADSAAREGFRTAGGVVLPKFIPLVF